MKYLGLTTVLEGKVIWINKKWIVSIEGEDSSKIRFAVPVTHIGDCHCIEFSESAEYVLERLDPT